MTSNTVAARPTLRRLLSLSAICLLSTGLATAATAQDEAPFPAELPSFKVLDATGAPVPSSRFSDNVVLIDFWASWCRPCHFTLPELERLHQEYGAREDFAVAGFAIDEGRSGAVRARNFAVKFGVTYDVFYDNASKPAKPLFGIEAVPVLFLVKDGKVLKRWDGEPDFSEVENEVRTALGLPSLSESLSETTETDEPES